MVTNFHGLTGKYKACYGFDVVKRRLIRVKEKLKPAGEISRSVQS